MSHFGLEFKSSRTANTKNGRFTIYEAEPNHAFWDAWKADKQSMYTKGYACSKDPQGKWKAQLWSKVAEPQPQPKPTNSWDDHTTTTDTQPSIPRGW